MYGQKTIEFSALDEVDRLCQEHEIRKLRIHQSLGNRGSLWTYESIRLQARVFNHAFQKTFRFVLGLAVLSVGRQTERADLVGQLDSPASLLQNDKHVFRHSRLPLRLWNALCTLQLLLNLLQKYMTHCEKYEKYK